MLWTSLEEVNGGWRFTVADGAGPRKFTIPFVRREKAWERYWEMVRPAYELWVNGKRDSIAFSLSQWCKLPAGTAIAQSSPIQAESLGMQRGEIQCSFCGKYASEVRQLIAGPTVYICDECVDDCEEIMVAKGIREARRPVADGDARLSTLLDLCVAPYAAHGGLPRILVDNVVTVREFAECNEDRLKRIEQKIDDLLRARNG